MTQLHFRIILIPKQNEEPDLQLLKQHVEEGGLSVLSFERVITDKKGHVVCPEFFEFVIDVRAEHQVVISNQNKVKVYRELCKKWKTVSSKYAPGQKLILQLCDNESFMNNRLLRHDIRTRVELSLGVHPRSGVFVSYRKDERYVLVDFIHDERYIQISQFTANEYFVKITYNSIRNIMVNIDSEVCEIYFDVLHPPLTFTRKLLLGLVPTGETIRTLESFGGVLGKANIIRLRFESRCDLLEILSCVRYRCEKMPIHYLQMTTIEKTAPACPTGDLGHFGCAFMLSAIFNRTFTVLEQTENPHKEIEKLMRYAEEHAGHLEKTLIAVLFAVDSGKFFNYWHAIDALYHHLVKQRQSVEYIVPEKCRMIRRVTFTPTRVLLWPPDLMYENRILRNFNSEYFLRVTFRDDDLSKLNFRTNRAAIYSTTINKNVNDGFYIGSRHYELLAWSNSQLREHGIAMYAVDTNNVTAHEIRRWTEISPYANMTLPKCLSRIGQCFSQTQETLSVPLDESHVRVENDVERSGYCFSDGVGKISTTLAKKVCDHLGSNKECSAFQIRFGGCKGMLVVDPTLKDVDIVFRKSMEKFPCVTHNRLEIAKQSAPISLRLNRQLIAILHDFGVKPEIFLQLQEDMLRNLTDMLLDEEVACQYLNFRTPFSVFKFKELSKSGIGLTMEPFFRSLLLALHRYQIDIIKHKANIEVDPSEGRNMFGVLDETGTLKYGQVFVQYTTDMSSAETVRDDAKILTGTVMVTKCPCVHPADVRKFEAVDVPALHHIVDCVVFPQNGPRPHPNEICGSDLDGDEYTVIWKKELIFQGENYEPPEYPTQTSEDYKNVQDFLRFSLPSEVTRFIHNYIRNDQIAAIASAHLAHADGGSVSSEMCKNIAAKHAVAVDFAKTGVSVSLDREERPSEYPDFMEKYWNKTYKSRKSLGKMYRVSRDFETENLSAMLRYSNVQVDSTLQVPGWEEYEDSALASKNKYNSYLNSILSTYGIEHESEAFGGAFIKLHSRFSVRRDRAEIVQVVHASLKDLVKRTKAEFIQEFERSGSLMEHCKAIQKKASAWYHVTYRERDPQFLSFPWVVSEFLANIKITESEQMTSTPSFYAPLVVRLETTIEEQRAAGLFINLPDPARYMLRSLTFHCDRAIVERAIVVLTEWGNDERIICLTNPEAKKYLYYKTFVRLIMYIAEKEQYVSQKDCAQDVVPAKAFSSASLCLSFFRYCMTLRFYNKRRVEDILPFQVFNYKLLSKRAMITYHSIAITGSFSTLSNEEYMGYQKKIFDMRPLTVNNAVFGRTPIEETVLRQGESILVNFSQAESVHMREKCQRNKVIVSASGTNFALQRLKGVLRKSDEVLMHLFLHGELPQLEENDG